VCQLFTKTVICAPAPIPNPNPDITDEINNSYSGAGGRTSGGGVNTNSPNPNLLLGGMGLLDLASGNGGRGGLAKSGPAVPGSGRVNIAGPTVTDPNGSASGSGSTTHSVGNAYSGAGGIAEGGGVTNNPSLVKLFSGNGGNAGDASSGPSGPVRILLSGLRLASAKSSSSPRRTRVARFYKIGQRTGKEMI